MIDDHGQLVASFRKHTLYQLENNFLSGGSEFVTFETPSGRVGLAICADIYNQQLLSSYKTLGVQVIGLRTSWAQMNLGKDTFTRAAVQTNAYVLAAGVINPDGSHQSHIRQSGDSITYGYLPLVLELQWEQIENLLERYLCKIKRSAAH